MSFWCIRMKTIFKSHNMWKFVEEGFVLPSNEKLTNEKQLLVAKDLVVCDAKALGLVQEDVSYEIFQGFTTTK